MTKDAVFLNRRNSHSRKSHSGIFHNMLSHAPVTQTDSMYFYVLQVNLWECVNFWQYKYLNKTWSNLTGNTNTVSREVRAPERECAYEFFRFKLEVPQHSNKYL